MEQNHEGNDGQELGLQKETFLRQEIEPIELDDSVISLILSNNFHRVRFRGKEYTVYINMSIPSEEGGRRYYKSILEESGKPIGSKEWTMKFYWENEIIKELIYERDEGVCRSCGVKGSPERRIRDSHPPRLILHHIIRRNDGGSNHPENLMMVCISCHNRIHRKKERDWATSNGFLVIEESEREIPIEERGPEYWKRQDEIDRTFIEKMGWG